MSIQGQPPEFSGQPSLTLAISRPLSARTTWWHCTARSLNDQEALPSAKRVPQTTSSDAQLWQSKRA